MMKRVDKKYQIISRLLIITGMSLLIFAESGWGLILMVPASLLRKDWIDKNLSKEFIAKNKVFCYIISGYMALGSLTLLILSLINSIQYSTHHIINYKILSFVYFIPAFILFAAFEYWLIKNETSARNNRLN